MRLLLLEDDDVLGEGLRDFLQAEDHIVDWVRELGAARALERDPFDALLVDWQLPDGSGVDWVRSLRRRGIATPVVVLTARDLLRDRIEGLDSGADDYLVKPFEPEELGARLRVIARRRAGASGSVVTVGLVELDLSAKQASLAGQRVDLTAREWALLEALMQRRGRIVGKRELELIVLGGEAEIASNALEVHVSSLRRKLGRDLIETQRGLGYRILAAA
ncbi:response regulator transcription factor [Roseateles asaccharophilus]|uniref:Two-component system OmpR family response regulator n=1 Tax=Roseateles asaccharophilus TaxID=582607 RepID=A0ABU2A357_9BURK|nr:response regulator transcription factor [Roseateles asaccharophilus]MDR7331624.1 two-component system OmpR family response regulator [Roseateles asaccharophilus]